VSDTSQGPGWWLASDGKWYPPELHPSRRPAPPEGAEAEPTVVAGGGASGRPLDAGAERTVVAGGAPGETLQLSSEPRPVRVARRTVWADLGILWHERRGLRVAVLTACVLIVVALLATIVGGKKGPTKVLTTVPSTVATTATTPTTSSTTTTTATTTTTVPATTTLPTTTVPPTTRPPVTTVPATSVPVLALCKDGTVSATTDRATACASHGGVQQFLS
jgi:hypothetical protein